MMRKLETKNTSSGTVRFVCRTAGERGIVCVQENANDTERTILVEKTCKKKCDHKSRSESSHSSFGQICDCPPGPPGIQGLPGKDGQQGAPGKDGTNGALGFAEYTRLIAQTAKAPGTAITIDNQIVNNMPGNLTMAAGAGGTVFVLTTGTYVFDYELSLDRASSVALYTGPSSGSLSIDKNTIAGSATATTWIHGRSGVLVPAGTLTVALSPVVSTPAIPLAGDSDVYMVRMTIMKVA